MAVLGTPRPRRRLVFVAAAIASVLLLLTACLNTGQQQVLNEMNADRRQSGRTMLNVQADAQSKAQAWATKLARENRIYHSTLSSGIRVRWCKLGENVGYGSSVAGIQNAYMASSGHRANILSTSWNGVGVGYARNGNRIFTVQVFIRTC